MPLTRKMSKNMKTISKKIVPSRKKADIKKKTKAKQFSLIISSNNILDSCKPAKENYQKDQKINQKS